MLSSSPQQSQMPVGPSKLCSLASLCSACSLGYQSLMLVSTHLLQPGRPLLGSLGYQSLVLVSRLASLSSAVSDASLSLLVSRICCNVLSLLSAARLVCPALAAASICVPFVRPFCQRGVSFLVPSYAAASHLCSAKILQYAAGTR